MRPQNDTGAAEQPQYGLQPMDDRPPGSSEEQADAEIAETPDSGRCWQYGSWPCGSRAQQEAEKKAPCPGLGMFYMLLSAFLFSVGALFVKKVQDIHAVEISAFRCVFQMLIIIPCLIYRKTGFIGPKDQRIFLILRGILGSVSMILIYYAYQSTSLADATVITFSCPVFTSIFACIFLKERYSPWDAVFTAFTLTGVTLIVRPPFLFGSNVEEMDRDYSVHLKGTFAALAHTVFAAVTLVLLRKMGKSVDYILSIWYYVVIGLSECVIVLFILGEWSLPRCGLDRLFLVLIGMFGLGGQVFLTKAIQIEKAGLVALMKTLEVVFAFIFQITFFNKVPSWWTAGGSLCVIASSTGAAIRKWYQSSH
uniref:Solute carrier family 35 member G1 n=1 Tax=Catagonus wagneri TaxID=51154 RepID=A0A8C3VNH8_9CETA